MLDPVGIPHFWGALTAKRMRRQNEDAANAYFLRLHLNDFNERSTKNYFYSKINK